MKKVIVALVLILTTFSISYAQNGQRGRGQMRQVIKDRMKTELALTEVQADTVMAIQQAFQGQIREVKTNENLSEADKASKVKGLENERKKRFKTIVNDEQIAKLEVFYENLRKMREQRQGQ